MTEPDRTAGTDRTASRLRAASGGLALVVAGIHLYWGIPRFTAYAAVGVMPDPRPLAFVLSGHAIILAITLVLVGSLAVERTYLPGILLLLVHLVGYAAWHTVLSHGVSGASHGHGHVHLGDAVLIVLEHLVNSPLALVSKLVELVAVVLLAVLYLAEVRDVALRE